MISFILLTTISWAEPIEPLDKVAAVVNDNVITQRELDAQVELLRMQLQAKQTSIPPDDVLRKQVLQHLIDVDLQLQIAKTNAIKVDATELDEAISRIAADNKLTLTQLREALAHEGMTWDMYRESLRKEMIISRLQQRSVGHEIDVSSRQIEDYIQMEKITHTANQSFHVQNIVIPLPEEPTSLQLRKAQKKAEKLLAELKRGQDFNLLAVAESSDEYALEGGDLGERRLAELPSLFADKVMKMQVGEVAGPIRAGNGLQLIKLVAINDNQEHHQVTKTHVRHILLKQDVNMTDTEALKQINNLYEQLKSGKDFGEMAKLYSLDSASAANGGDLGWVVSEELVKPFAEAMAELPLHTVSKPVKSQFGWHLIEVIERKEIDDSKAFKRQQVRMLLQQRKFNEAVQNWKQHMRAEAYVNILDKNIA
jgi:peptidyl-prolyl cis-trans isomerase SurA